MEAGRRKGTHETRRTLLVVGDDVHWRASLAKLLIASGYKVELAEAPKRALALAADGSVDLGVILITRTREETARLASGLADRCGRVLVVLRDPELVVRCDAAIESIVSSSSEEILDRIHGLFMSETTGGDDGRDQIIIKFDRFILDVAAHSLTTASGQDVNLTTGEFSLLYALASSAKKVLSREQIRSSLTGRGLDVYDRSVDIMISRLRRKIELDPKKPTLVVTVPGVGYKLATSVAYEAEIGKPTSNRLRPPEDRASIAILSFEDMSGGASDLTKFGDSLAEDIIANLSQYTELKVVARNSSFAYKSKTVDVRRIGSELGAHFVVEGSIRRVDARLRVVAQLIEAIDGSHLWADRFDCDAQRNVLQIQDSLTREIVAAIRQKLIPPRASPDGIAGTRQVPVVLSFRLIWEPECLQQVDTDVLRRVLSSHLQLGKDAVHRFGGRVAHVQPDCFDAYFGLPPEEKGAEGAIRAALEMRDFVARLDGQDAGVLGIAIAITSGPVVMVPADESGRSGGYSAVGDAVTRARRASTELDQSGIVICTQCRSIVGGQFEYEPVVAPSGNWFRVLADATDAHRFAARQEGRSVRLVGRGEDLKRLVKTWDDAKRDGGRVVLLSGDPGIGKSRLLAGLREQIESDAGDVVDFACLPHGKDAAFLPIVERIIRIAGIESGDSAARRRSKLQAFFPAIGNDATMFALLDTLVSRPEHLDPERSPEALAQRRTSLLDILLTGLVDQVGDRPTLIEFEDLHWADSATLELLSLLVERVSEMRVLVVITARPEFAIPWPEPEHFTKISLSRLSRRASAELVGSLAPSHRLAQREVDRIVERADGIPIFIEELTQELIRERDRRTDVTAIPATLKALLLGRLWQLGAARATASMLAALGRQFSHDLALEATLLPTTVLDEHMNRLIGAGFLFRRGQNPTTIYTFKHALIQELVYQDLDLRTRELLHARIADTIIERFPDLARADPWSLARHCMEGRRFLEAARYSLASAEGSLAIGMVQETLTQCRYAQQALEHVQPGGEKSRFELQSLRMSLPALIATRGYTHTETAAAYARAKVLCRELNLDIELAVIEDGIFRQHLVEANYAAALRVCEEAHASGRATAELGFGIVTLHQGNLTAATNWLARACAVVRSRANVDKLEAMTLVGAPAYHSMALAIAGEQQKSETEMLQTLAVSDRFKHPMVRAFALSALTRVTWLLQSDAENAAFANELVTICHDNDFKYWLATAECYLGWHLTKSGQTKEGLATINSALAKYRETGARWLYPYFLGIATDADRVAGRFSEALERVDEALLLCTVSGEAWFDAELLRLRGALLRELGRTEAARECLLSAKATVARQGAHLYAERINRELALLTV